MSRSVVLVSALTMASCTATTGTETSIAPPETTTTLAPTTSTAVPATTTSVPDTTTSVVTDADGYPVSDEYEVSTVVADIDAGTGGLAVDADGNLYTADFGYPDHEGNTVFRVTPDGIVTPFATSELMSSLTGNTFGPDGTLYQSSFGSSNVLTISPEGVVSLLTSEIRGPTGIVVTGDGRVFVASCRRNQVSEVFEDGSVEVIAEGVGMNCPNGLTIDPEGNLYVVNFNSGFVQRITPDGDTEAIFRFPTGNAHVIYSDGYLFVTARIDHRVYRYDIATQEVTVIAGTGEAGFDDGPGNSATIARPNAIALGHDGTLYINHGNIDGTNAPTTIRAIRPPR